MTEPAELQLSKQQRAGLKYVLIIALHEPYQTDAPALETQAHNFRAAAALAYRFGFAEIGRDFDIRARIARGKTWETTETHI